MRAPSARRQLVIGVFPGGSSLVFWWTLCAVYGGVALAGTAQGNHSVSEM